MLGFAVEVGRSSAKGGSGEAASDFHKLFNSGVEKAQSLK